MGKWSRDEKVLVFMLTLVAVLSLGIVLSLGMWAAMKINYAFSEEIGREAPAKVEYVRCAEWQSGYKRQHCVRYVTSYETRAVIHHSGIWWDYDTYIVVQ